MRYRAPHRARGECWADADRAGTHARGCQRSLPALRVGESVPGLFQNARIHLSAVRKGRPASGLVSSWPCRRGPPPTEVRHNDYALMETYLSTILNHQRRATEQRQQKMVS